MRAFIAINLPDPVRRDLWTATTELRSAYRDVRWVPTEAIHLTLKFLGEIAESMERDVIAAIESAVQGVKPFDLAVSGIGAFPSMTRPSVVWVGCDGGPHLELIQHGVERECAAVGFALDGRPFRPHLTLGRTKRGVSPDLKGFLQMASRLSVNGTALISSVELMRSVLGPEGASYTRRHSVALSS